MRSDLAGRCRHLLLQVLCLRPKHPSLRLTEDARSALLRQLSEITDYTPAATLIWGSPGTPDGVMGRPRWVLVFCDVTKRSFGRVRKIDGIQFFFNQSEAYTRLNGALLDLHNGRFVVTESAS